MKKVLCVGNAVLDQIFLMKTLPTEPGKHFAHSYLESGGGPAATASVAVSRLGGTARLWSRIGDDSPGDRIVKELEGYGVNVPVHCRIPGVASSIAGLSVDEKGERISVNYLDAKLPQDAHWLPLAEVAGFGCALGDIRWPGGSEAVFHAAAKVGVPTVLDADRAPSREILERVVPLADHVIFSEGGLLQYSGEEKYEAALAKVAGMMRGIPYVTLGGKGCFWIHDEAISHSPAFTVDVVDTTGAGDVFHGAFALAIAERMPVPAALRFASATAALKCTRPGGRAGIPDRATLDAFLRQHS
jgi:sulfofructose kinase